MEVLDELRQRFPMLLLGDKQDSKGRGLLTTPPLPTQALDQERRPKTKAHGKTSLGTVRGAEHG
jgi:hypothetical protein